MKTFDLKKVLQTPPSFESSEGRKARFWDLAAFDGGSSWIGIWVGESPWERHSAGDEFLHVLEGEVEVIVITSGGKKSFMVKEGNVFVVPKNHWHRQIASAQVMVLGATPGITDHSENEPSFSTVKI